MRDFIVGMEIAASGMRAQRIRMNVISSNLANINTTRSPYGGPYMRKEVVFSAWYEDYWLPQLPLVKLAWPPVPVPVQPYLARVDVAEIIEDPRPPILKYEPNHPDADENGYVAYPNINVVEEMVNLIAATRAYDAQVTVSTAIKDMALRALDIARV